MKLSIKLLSVFLISTLFFPVISQFASAESTVSLSAQSACLIEAESGKVLYSKSGSRRMPMASTTKIMTAIVALESGIPLDTIISVPREATGIEGSSIYMQEGEKITFEALLYALLLSSANDASVAIAITVAESLDDFVSLMNEKSARLGLSDTHFTNPHGLYDEEHYSTAHDLARLMAYCMKNETFAKITSTQKITFPRGEDSVRVLINHNKLLKTCDGVIGGKTGFTKKSGRCLVSVAERDGLKLIAVTLNAPSDWADHSALYDFGFSNYKRINFEKISMTIPVISGTKSEVRVSSKEDISLFMPNEAGEVKCRIELPRFVFARIKSGERVGRAIYTLNGKTVAVADIYADENVARQTYKFNFFEWLKNLLGL
ncbi:MAG: D-alanyl-D-alanine carboxypeptidase family protein [Eubacteriales bacterium]